MDSTTSNFLTTNHHSDKTAIAYSLHQHRGSNLPVLVLIHGVCHSRYAWDDVIAHLVNDFRVITVDLPGHGESGRPTIETSTSEDMGKRMLAELRAFLDELSATLPDADTKPHIAGNSLGGYFALELARQGYAASAVAFNPAGFFHGKLDQIRTASQFLVLYGTAKVLRKLLPTMAKTKVGRTAMFGMFSARPWKLSPEQVSRDAAGMLKNNIFLSALDTKFSFSADTGQAAQTCYWGTTDLTLIRGWKRHYDVLPNAELHLLPKLGHVPMVDDARQVAAAILASARPRL